MIRTALSFTRPNISIPWHTDPEAGIQTYEMTKIIWMEFISTVRILFSNRIISEDQLTLTIIAYWDNEASRIEYQNHPLLSQMIVDRDNYYANNNGTVGILDVSEVTDIRPEDIT